MFIEELTVVIDIDGDLSEDERLCVEQLILEEVGDTESMHPSVESVYPMPTASGILGELTEEEILSKDFTLGGIDMQRYDQLDDADCLQMLLSYTYLRANSLRICQDECVSQWTQCNEEQSLVNGSLSAEISRKRRKIESINAQRQLEQEEAHPLLSYLEHRWVQGIQKNVQLGIELLKEQNGLE